MRVVSEHLVIEGDDVVKCHLAGIAGGAHVGKSLFGQTGNVGLFDSQVAQMLGDADEDGEIFYGLACCL